MTSTAQAVPAPTPSEPPVEEHYYRRGDIDFCFLLNRAHGNLRIFDYRVGNYQQKRDFFDRIARSEGLRKVFTVVEKQDSKSWRSVGFSREGAIPGYFRTADAYIMSRVYTDDGDPIQGGAPKFNAPSIVTHEPNAVKPRGMSVELVTDVPRLESVATQLAEAAAYAPFRRTTLCPDIAVHARVGRREFWVGAETDSSFGHAKIDVLSPPVKDTDLPNLEFMLKMLMDELGRMEMSSLFSIIPADWATSGQIYASLGFKVSARLTDHIARDLDYVGAQIWHKRLGNVVTPRMPSFI